MKVEIKNVMEIANLCRLEITEEEAARQAEQLENILGYMEQLSKLDTAGIEPLYQSFPVENVWREDTVSASLEKEKVFANAPEEEDDYFQVPAVREG